LRKVRLPFKSIFTITVVYSIRSQFIAPLYQTDGASRQHLIKMLLGNQSFPISHQVGSIRILAVNGRSLDQSFPGCPAAEKLPDFAFVAIQPAGIGIDIF